MDTECSDIGTCLTADPEDAKVSLFVVLNDLALIHSPDSQFLLHSGNQGWSLEDGSGQLLEGLVQLLGLVDGLMELDHCHILLPGRLLGLDQPGRIIDTHYQTPGDLGIQGATVTRLVHLKDLLDPGDDLVG